MSQYGILAALTVISGILAMAAIAEHIEIGRLIERKREITVQRDEAMDAFKRVQASFDSMFRSFCTEERAFNQVVRAVSAGPVDVKVTEGCSTALAATK